jgi:hypothetical protein
MKNHVTTQIFGEQNLTPCTLVIVSCSYYGITYKLHHECNIISIPRITNIKVLIYCISIMEYINTTLLVEYQK